MTTRVRATDPVHFLSLVPELVGFEPVDSLVLVLMDGPMTCGTLRVDLPPEGDPDFAPAIARPLRQARTADAAIAVIYSSGSCVDDEPGAALVEQLEESLDEVADLELRHAYFVAADGWGDYVSPSKPRDELDAAVALRRLDPDSRALRGTPHEQAELPRRGVFECERTARELSVRRTDAVHGHDGIDPVWFADYSATWQPEDVGPAMAALLRLMLGSPADRDVMLCTWGWGPDHGRHALDFQERFARGEPVDENDEAALFLGGEGTIGRPRVEAIEHITGVLREVGALLPVSERAPVLAVLGWLSWALGHGSVAGNYVRQAREIDPEHGLAGLLELILDNGILPSWSFRPSRGERRQAAGRAR
jgi:hypothetical protein